MLGALGTFPTFGDVSIPIILHATAQLREARCRFDFLRHHSNRQTTVGLERGSFYWTVETEPEQRTLCGSIDQYIACPSVHLVRL